MLRRDGPRSFSLGSTRLVLLGLISRAFGLWAVSWLGARGWLRMRSGAVARAPGALCAPLRRRRHPLSRRPDQARAGGEPARRRRARRPSPTSWRGCRIASSRTPSRRSGPSSKPSWRRRSRPVSPPSPSSRSRPRASGQVHRARTLDGRDVAVKVLYPGIERSVAVDLAMTTARALAVRLDRDRGPDAGLPRAARVPARARWTTCARGAPARRSRATSRATPSSRRASACRASTGI